MNGRVRMEDNEWKRKKWKRINGRERMVEK